MTTTTAKRTGGLRFKPNRGLPRLVPVAAAIAALLVAAPSRADWRFTPGLSVTETWSDNPELLSDELARTQLVSEVAPSFNFVMNSRRVKASASGLWRQYAYTESTSVRPREHHDRQYGASLQGILAEDLLFVDASANGQRRTLSAFGPQVTNNPYSWANGTDVQTWSISPYLKHDFGRSATAQLRYTRDSVTSDQRTIFGNSTADTVLLNLSSPQEPRLLSWGLSVMHQKQDNEIAGESSIENATANLRYRLNSELALTATAGYDRYDFNALGGQTGGRSWTTGFAWTPSQRTSIEASIGRHFYGTTGSLMANVRSRRTVWSISYGDTITTTRSQVTLPSAIDTAALLDRLFSSTIPDPLQRQLAIAAYMQATGLPPSLADSVNYLSNRYMRQKLLQATAALRGARANTIFSLYGSDRTALSSDEADSGLLGSQLRSLNDNVRQRGASATWSYSLNARSSVVANASFSHNRSITTGIEDRQRHLSLAANRKLGQNLVASLELRRRSGNVNRNDQRDYKEHAIAATISMKL